MRLFWRFVLSIPLALIWMLLTARLTIGGFLVGLILGFALLSLLRSSVVREDWKRLPDQIAGLVIYALTLGRDVILAGFVVARRVLSPNMGLSTGIIAIPVQDEEEREIIAALSAHAISVTPGELVIEFDGSRTMYIHCLVVEQTIRNEQAKGQPHRVRMYRRILGL